MWGISVFTGTSSWYYSMVSVLLFFHVSSYSLLIFLNPHSATLVSGVFVEVDLPYMAPQNGADQ